MFPFELSFQNVAGHPSPPAPYLQLCFLQINLTYFYLGDVHGKSYIHYTIIQYLHYNSLKPFA